jgi:hypothetical protein
MQIVDRLFTQIGPKPKSNEEATKPLSAFFDKPAIVLLGDPGSGKTTSFINSAKIEKNAVYVKVRDFLTLDVKTRWKGRTLYLDGFDEQRAKSEDGSVVLDQIRGRLDALGCPPFRLSCRADDWYGSSDAESLSLVSSDYSVITLGIEPLKESDIIAIIKDFLPSPKSFIEEVKSKGIFELLVNPQTLKMILEVVLHEGQLPKTRMELFHRTAEILIKEHNPNHDRIYETQYTDEKILEAAGYLCAVQLCGGIEGFALSRQQESDLFLFVPELNNDRKITTIAARRRIFISIDSECVIPAHRTIAEFLAAYFLDRHVHKGFQIERLLAIITGYDGGVLTDLRGLYAWLACICQEYAKMLLPKDPFGVILYGDITPLNYTIKKSIIDNLIKLAHRNPWFRSENYASHPFGRLAVTEMIPFFRNILENKAEHPVVIGFILNAIRYGKPLPQLCNSLYRIVCDNERVGYIRYDALKTFQDICPENDKDLLDLLSDIQEGKINDDEHNNLRASLLNKFYPCQIGSDQIIGYLVEEDPTFIGEYFIFITHGLIEKTDPKNLPLLIEYVINSDIRKRNSYLWKKFKGKLLIETLICHGEQVKSSRLYNWLCLAMNEHGTVREVKKEESEAIREWFENHSDRTKNLFKYWVSVTDGVSLLKKDYRFWERLHRVERPKGFAQWLLEWIDSEPKHQAVNFLFKSALQILTLWNREDAPPIEEYFLFAEKHPHLSKVLNSGLYCEISEWRIESALRDKEFKETELKHKRENLQWLMEDIEEIVRGSNLKKLVYLAKIYLGLFSDIDEDASPISRIVQLTNPIVAQAASKGFIAMLQSKKIQTPLEIGKLHTESRVFNLGYPVLAGMDIMNEKYFKNLLTLPDKTLKAALVYNFTNDGARNRPWIIELIKKRPELSANSLLEFWRPYFKKKSENVPGLYKLAYNEDFENIACRIPLPLLNEFPNCEQSSLKTLIFAAFRYSKHSDLLDLSSRALTHRGLLRGVQRIYWYATGFLLEPDRFSAKMIRYFGNSKKKLRQLINFTSDIREEQKNIDITITPQQISFIIKISGRTFKPHETITGEPPTGRVQNYIETLIDQLSNYTDWTANQLFTELCKDPLLSAWKEKLNSAFDIYIRNHREAVFCYPTSSQVISSLAQGPPANNSDLQAILYSQLCVMRDEIKNGSTDGYKIFWNVDSYSRPLKGARPENDGRNRILEKLQPNLHRIGIQAEAEGRYAENKRADIKVLYSKFNLPIEIKRHYHSDLWNAPINQLKKLYMRDPGAAQRGIYLILWFGTDYKKVPRPPMGITRPKTSKDLEVALNQLIPERKKYLIKFIVFDVSRPVERSNQKLGLR